MPNELPDDAFAEHVSRALAGLQGVAAVMLGGSRAGGDHTPESDWDFALYYRGGFDVEQVRALGWAGEVFALGGWGGGVFNGGAWLELDGRRVDVHYRDLGDVEQRVAEAEQGTFAIEYLPFYLAGIPTYVVVAELALGRVLAGELPTPVYSEALKRCAAGRWQRQADATLAYAERAYALKGDAIGVAGAAARALLEASHARLASRGVWVTNEKTLLARAGLSRAAASFEQLESRPQALALFIERIRQLIAEA